jgi:hypothetical protein
MEQDDLKRMSSMAVMDVASSRMADQTTSTFKFRPNTDVIYALRPLSMSHATPTTSITDIFPMPFAATHHRLPTSLYIATAW